MGCKRTIPILLLLGLSACSHNDALSRTDTVTVEAGDAKARNIRMHAVNPVAGQSPVPAPGADGVRAISTFVAYRRGELRERHDGRQEQAQSSD